MADSSKLSNNEKNILEDLINELELLSFYRKKASMKEKGFYDIAIDNFIEKINLLSQQIPGFIGADLIKKLEELKREIEKEKPSRKTLLKQRKRIITEIGNLQINKEDKERFLKDVQLTKEELKRLRKTLELSTKERKRIPMSAYFRKPNPFVVLSSKLFFDTSISFSKKDVYRIA